MAWAPHSTYLFDWKFRHTPHERTDEEEEAHRGSSRTKRRRIEYDQSMACSNPNPSPREFSFSVVIHPSNVYLERSISGGERCRMMDRASLPFETSEFHADTSSLKGQGQCGFQMLLDDVVSEFFAGMGLDVELVDQAAQDLGDVLFRASLESAPTTERVWVEADLVIYHLYVPDNPLYSSSSPSPSDSMDLCCD